MGRLALILALIFLLFAPCLATEDLTGEDYITPAYGHFLSGNYYYENDGANWRVSGSTFESNGYYTVCSDVGISLITAGIEINSPFAGNLSLCVADSPGGAGNCEYVGHYSDVGNYDYFLGEFDFDDWSITGGKYYFYVKNALDVGGSQSSRYYSIYYNPEERYSVKRPISISSSDMLSDGVLTLTLNSTILSEFNAYDIAYDNSNYYTLSGTFSNLLFMDAAGTKAYPYYVDTYKGGYYDFEQNTTDEAVIKIFIDEDVYTKGLIMYYNYYAPTILEGYYNLSDNYDSNNNPFLIYQVFSDWRWNETFFKNNIGNFSVEYNYSRGQYLYIDEYTTSEVEPLSYSKYNISTIKTIHHTSTSDSEFYINDNYPSYPYLFHQTYQTILLYNNSLGGSSGDINESYDEILNAYIIHNTTDILLYINELLTLNLTETNNRYNNISIYMVAYDAPTSTYCYEYSERKNISSTSTIYDTQNTTAYPEVLLNIYDIGATYINDIFISSYLTTDVGGTLSCELDTGAPIDDVLIPDLGYSNTFHVLMTYTLADSNFLNETNVTNLSYSCAFTTDTATYESDNRTISFMSDRIYLSDFVPVNFAFKSLPNVNYNIDLENATNTDVDIYIKLLDCDILYDNKCIMYSEIYNVQTEHFTNPTNIGFNLDGDYGTCYLTYYFFEKNNETVWTYRMLCVENQSGDYTLPDSPSITFVDWNDSSITINDTYALFWDNPLYYISSWTFQVAVQPYTDVTFQNIIIIIFYIVFNFYLVAIAIGIETYMVVKDLKIAVVVGYISLYAFALLGWLGRFSTLSAATITVLFSAFAAVCIYISMRYSA